MQFNSNEQFYQAGPDIDESTIFANEPQSESQVKLQSEVFEDGPGEITKIWGPAIELPLSEKPEPSRIIINIPNPDNSISYNSTNKKLIGYERPKDKKIPFMKNIKITIESAKKEILENNDKSTKYLFCAFLASIVGSAIYLSSGEQDPKMNEFYNNQNEVVESK